MYTQDLKRACERVAKGCKQCQAHIPKNQKAERLLKGLPIPEWFFDKVTGDAPKSVLYWEFIISVPEFMTIEPSLLNELEEFLSTF